MNLCRDAASNYYIDRVGWCLAKTAQDTPRPSRNRRLFPSRPDTVVETTRREMLIWESTRSTEHLLSCLLKLDTCDQTSQNSKPPRSHPKFTISEIMIRHNFMPRQVATFDAHRMSNQPLYQFESMARPRALLADLPPSPDRMALAELRLAQIVLEARIQASANMSNFFRQQNTVAPRDFPLLSKPRGFEALTRASIPSDDASVATEKQSLSDKSEQSSLDCSSTHEESKQTVYVDTIRDTDVLCGKSRVGGRQACL